MPSASSYRLVAVAAQHITDIVLVGGPELSLGFPCSFSDWFWEGGTSLKKTRQSRVCVLFHAIPQVSAVGFVQLLLGVFWQHEWTLPVSDLNTTLKTSAVLFSTKPTQKNNYAA